MDPEQHDCVNTQFRLDPKGLDPGGAVAFNQISMGQDDEQSDLGATTGRNLHYVGRVAEFFAGRGMGSVVTGTGREVDFDLRFCRLGSERGSAQRPELEAGTSVAFDLGWTSNGLRVTWMRPLGAQELELERQAGAEGEVAPKDAADEDGQRGDIE